MAGKTYRELYQWIREEVESAFEAGELFAYATTYKQQRLAIIGDNAVPYSLLKKAEHAVSQRKKGEPLQYILGEWEFYGLPFYVGAGVLIPRSDTEHLVDIALEKGKKFLNPKVLDLCSGSGCIAIAIDTYMSNAEVTALELSPEAFPYLEKNIHLNKSKVTPLQQDVLSYRHPDLVDIIVSNPPYIPREDLENLQIEVKQEPVGALDGGIDGLDFYREITASYYDQLAKDGWLCFEVGIYQSEAVKELMSQQGFWEIEITKDYSGIPRVIAGKK